jgi:hypothetical protein
VRETQTTSAPSAANFKAMARPIPRPAPVTTAIWLASMLIFRKHLMIRNSSREFFETKNSNRLATNNEKKENHYA